MEKKKMHLVIMGNRALISAVKSSDLKFEKLFKVNTLFQQAVLSYIQKHNIEILNKKSFTWL